MSIKRAIISRQLKITDPIQPFHICAGRKYRCRVIRRHRQHSACRGIDLHGHFPRAPAARERFRRRKRQKDACARTSALASARSLRFRASASDRHSVRRADHGAVQQAGRRQARRACRARTRPLFYRLFRRRNQHRLRRICRRLCKSSGKLCHFHSPRRGTNHSGGASSARVRRYRRYLALFPRRGSPDASLFRPFSRIFFQKICKIGKKFLTYTEKLNTIRDEYHILKRR